MITVAIVRTDIRDWEGLYINGALVKQGTDISLEEAISAILAMSGCGNLDCIEVNEEELRRLDFTLPKYLGKIYAVKGYRDAFRS